MPVYDCKSDLFATHDVDLYKYDEFIRFLHEEIEERRSSGLEYSEYEYILDILEKFKNKPEEYKKLVNGLRERTILLDLDDIINPIDTGEEKLREVLKKYLEEDLEFNIDDVKVRLTDREKKYLIYTLPKILAEHSSCYLSETSMRKCTMYNRNSIRSFNIDDWIEFLQRCFGIIIKTDEVTMLIQPTPNPNCPQIWRLITRSGLVIRIELSEPTLVPAYAKRIALLKKEKYTEPCLFVTFETINRNQTHQQNT